MACPTAFLVKDPSRGIGWTSLMINRKPTYASWGSWLRPQRGSADEQFVIDRCTTLQLYTGLPEKASSRPIRQRAKLGRAGACLFMRG